MIRKFFPLVFVAVSGCAIAIPDFRPAPVAVAPPDPAPAVNPQSAKERFIQSAAANGCVVNAATSDAVMAGAILSREDMGQVMQQLIAEGRGRIAADQQSFRVTSGACA